MIDTLIPMVDYVIYEVDNWNEDAGATLLRIENYAKFLKQPLTLGMFVPIDEEGNVLEEPQSYYYRSSYDCAFHNYNWKEYYNKAVDKYNKAKENVLFEGFSICDPDGRHVSKGMVFIGIGFKNGMHKTIEDLCKYGLKLTEQGKKQWLTGK